MKPSLLDVLRPGGYGWRFFRAGGLDQVRLRNGEDLAHLHELDQTLWVVLSCPVRGVVFDARTLDLIDTDRDGRIRVPELLAAVRWSLLRLKRPDDLLAGSAELQLDAINDQTPEGARLLAGARRILENQGQAGAGRVTLADVADRARIFAQTRFNGDGIITEFAAEDDDTRSVIRDIVACLGGETDRSGLPGVSQTRLAAFFTAAQAYSDWWAHAENDPAIQPLGESTAAAAIAWQAVRAKIDDYFVRCRLAAFDSRAAAPLNREPADYAALAPLNLSAADSAIAALPLSQVAPTRPLPLTEGVNPAWVEALAGFRRLAVEPLLGTAAAESLGEAQWLELCARLTPFQQWQQAKAGLEVEPLGLVRVRALLAGTAQAAIADLIARDAALEAENAQIHDVERLLCYSQHLCRLLHNYVNFADFYDPDNAEIFRVGRLHMDARMCELCVHVDDVGKHATLAATSKMCLAYCEITQPATGAKRNICAAFTAGFAESLWVGRNGIFYDRDGRDWDAVIVKMLDSPISLKEAFWSPWRKIAAMVGDQVKKILTARQEAALNAASTNVELVAHKAAAPSASAPPAGAPNRMEGAALASSVAAVGIAVGLVGSAVGGLISTLSGLPLWKSLVGVLAVILAISGPSVILTYFRLRARDLAPILNACGWAVNSRIRMTMRLGREFTQEARLPPGAIRQLTDPYADSHRLRNLVVVLAVLTVVVLTLWHAGWYAGWGRC